jgi:hypothetical protein
MSDKQKLLSEKANPGLQLDKILYGAGLLATGVIIVSVAFVAIRRLDLISLLGLDVLFAPDGSLDVKSQPYYIAVNLLASFVGALSVALSAYVFRKNQARRAEREAMDPERTLSETPRKPDGSPAGNDDKAAESGPQTRRTPQAAIDHLNKRIAILSVRATTIYWTIIFSLVAGVFLIIFAGYLSSFDTTLGTVTARIDADRQFALRDVDRYASSRARGPNDPLDPTYDYLFARLKTVDDNIKS